MRLNKFFLVALLFCGCAFAHEAPVVDAQQDAVSTQPEAVSGSSGWQTVTNDNAEKPASTTSPPVAQQEWAPTPTQQTAQSGGSVNKRVSRLEQQMANYTQMNLPQQVSDMQQKISQLQGQVEVDQRELKTLTDQQKTYYQDLEQQLAQLHASPTPTSVPPTAAAAVTTTSATLAADIKKDKNDTSENDQTATPSLGDADAYNKAFRLLSRKHFNQAQSAFKNYLQDYPKGQFAVNAHFWLGEIALMNQHYDDAISQFKTVVTQYPTSNKVSDAKLKIAMIHAAKGETDKAKKEFTQIRKDYPGSTAAQLASIRLQQISGGVS